LLSYWFSKTAPVDFAKRSPSATSFPALRMLDDCKRRFSIQVGALNLPRELTATCVIGSDFASTSLQIVGPITPQKFAPHG
jgi:hypothetical protein